MECAVLRICLAPEGFAVHVGSQNLTGFAVVPENMVPMENAVLWGPGSQMECAVHQIGLGQMEYAVLQDRLGRIRYAVLQDRLGPGEYAVPLTKKNPIEDAVL